MEWSVSVDWNCLVRGVFCVYGCVYLLHILLEHAQLQPLVQSDLSMLPDILKTPLMVEDLMHNIQDAMNLQNNSDVTGITVEIFSLSCFCKKRRGTMVLTALE